MTYTRKKYEAALAAFAAPGGRWANKGELTYWGKAAGLSADEIIADARAAGVTDRDADIRRGWEDARPKGEAVRGEYAARVKPKPKRPRFAAHVRSILAGVDADNGAPDWVRELSPFDVRRLTPTEQTVAFLRSAFRPDERLFVFKSNEPTVGRPVANIRTCDEWLNDVEAVRQCGDLVKTNPFTGERGRTKNGQPSYVSQDCLAAYPFALIEFDAMPLPMQYAFWRNFILTSPLAPSLVSVTYSGGKSLHALLHIGAATLDEWQRARARLLALFASDPDARFRVDPQAMHPLIGTRIPGVTRRGNGALQELLYLNPSARHSPQTPEAPPTTATEPQTAATEAPPEEPTATESQTEYRYHCSTCGCAARCREAWGRYWVEKSGGGIGCSAPVKVA